MTKRSSLHRIVNTVRWPGPKLDGVNVLRLGRAAYAVEVVMHELLVIDDGSG